MKTITAHYIDGALVESHGNVAAGCTVVIKPSELSSLQAQVMIECLDAAKPPKGVCNVVIGRGDVG